LKDMILTSQELDLVFHKIPAFSVECHGWQYQMLFFKSIKTTRLNIFYLYSYTSH
jgi:hypothetical protein